MAQKWYSMGCRTLDDVSSKVPRLSHMQKLGLKYYDGMQRKIGRLEMEKALETVKQAIASTDHARDMVDACIAGSYRRGKASTHDVGKQLQGMKCIYNVILMFLYH